MKKVIFVILFATGWTLASIFGFKIYIAEYAMGERTAVPTHKCAVIWFNGKATEPICRQLIKD